MSQMTKEINKITKTIIGISGKLILYALVILLLVEGMTRGYAFGYSIFYATPMEAAPGRDFRVTVPEDQDPRETIATLKDMGLIANELAVQIQMWFYDYDIYPGTYELNTSMTSKEILQLLNEKPAASEEESGADEQESGNVDEPEENIDELEENAGGRENSDGEDAANSRENDDSEDTADDRGIDEDTQVEIETGGTD